MPQVAARISAENELKLKQFFKTKSAGAEFILPWAMETFYRTVAQLKEDFSPGELKTILEAYKGAALTPDQCKLSYLQLRVKEAMDENELHTQHGASKGTLERKLDKLNDTQAAALMIWAAAYWNSKIWKDVSMDDYLRQTVV